MKVSEAVARRHSARAFLDRPVDLDRVRDILDRARRSPSGGNLQPWFVDVVAGKPLRKLIGKVRRAALLHPRGESPEYDVYPPDLHEPYRSRRYRCGEDLYAALGIPREDKKARLKQFAKNLEGFGAPVVLLFSIDRRMGRNQWAHLGMFMQTIMLLAVEQGLDTCPQESWSAFHSVVTKYLDLPEDRQFYCGMALGYADADHPVNRWRTERAPLDEFARFFTDL